MSLCLVFGVVTSGWGLLACGAVGGLGGSYAGSRAYQSLNPRQSLMEIERTGTLDKQLLRPYNGR